MRTCSRGGSGGNFLIIEDPDDDNHDDGNVGGDDTGDRGAELGRGYRGTRAPKS